MTAGPRALRSDEPLAAELTAAIKQDDVVRLSQLLAEDPRLAHCVFEDTKGGERTPLHLFADWPGTQSECRPLVQTLPAAGTDLNAPTVRMWHCETPLH